MPLLRIVVLDRHAIGHGDLVTHDPGLHRLPFAGLAGARPSAPRATRCNGAVSAELRLLAVVIENLDLMATSRGRYTPELDPGGIR